MASAFETASTAGADTLPAQRRVGKRSRVVANDDGGPTRGDSSNTDTAIEPRAKRSRVLRLLRYRRAPPPQASATAAAAEDCKAGRASRPSAASDGCVCPALPLELVSLIVNGCDAAGRPFMHARWRPAARAVCRDWYRVVQHPSASDAARIAASLVDPRPSVRQLWVSGRLLCASAMAERLAVDPGLGPDAWLSAESWPPSPPPLLAAAALVASARPDAVACAFSRHVSPHAIAWLRAWLRRDRDARSAGVDVLRPPTTSCDGAPGPDTWWIAGRGDAPPLRPWEAMRRVVGGCARAAFLAILLRVAARHDSTCALDLLLAVDDTPCGAADAAFDSAAGGHASFVLRLASLVAATGGDRSRAATLCYHAWLGAAAGGHAHVMHALLDAESKRGALATALWRGRCLSDGSPRHPRTASHIALVHDRTGYFEVARARDPAYRDATHSLPSQPPPPWVCRPIDAYLVEALRMGALDVARWLVDDARAACGPDRTTVDASLSALALSGLIEAVVDGRGPRERARRTIEWVRDMLRVDPGPSTLGVLVDSAQAFRWTRPGSAAARGRLNADRYARLLDVLVDVIEVWPQTAVVEVERDDNNDGDGSGDHADNDDGDDDGNGREDPYNMCRRRDGGGHAYGACVVRLIVERASCGRIAGDRHGRRHARRRALAALDRLAACVAAAMPRGDPTVAASRHCTDPWTVAVARVRAEIEALERSSAAASPMRALDALLGAAAVAHRCMLSPTIASALVGPDHGGLPPMLFGLVVRMRDKGLGPDDDRARAWRQWCRLSRVPDDGTTDARGHATTLGRNDAAPSEFGCIGVWAECIYKHLVATH
ncbi:hypothetical protein pdul_cds_323 [Pandoravirus dulcis]|uniref:F-box domain containing protein n=1 Tax=Pandoravirus dulcis TaxID=1349409 RepID=S4VSE6_9VIRU|nr:hypothetical protein pdul_cds_323 [Pandoravirus dulcis]AGO82330.1 hypothetical protein pdul_cds_323 [Pandoravirus dulcis]